MLTISQFSSRTGIPASALRFYERKGLLLPRRLANGYRTYTPDQAEDAKLINSLREVGVSVADIRHFLAPGHCAARAAALWPKHCQAQPGA